MAAGNMNLRDPIIYRVRHAAHHQTGDAWCIYPSYDFAHGQSDAIEGVTHSICTLEFEDHRPLYNWFIEHLPVPARPVQYEFGRLHLNYTITSKRRLRRLIDAGIVDGWDDPRMPTLSGIRRRGYTPASIRAFCETVGVSRSDGVVDTAVLENAVRDDLNHNAPRAMCVMDPLKLVITNLPEEAVEMLAAPGHRTATICPRARCRSRARSSSRRPTSASRRTRSTSAWCSASGCGCATPMSSRPRTWSATTPAK